MDIASLLSSLSEEDVEKLKATAQQFFGENHNSQNTSAVKTENSKPNAGIPGFPFDAKMLSGVARISEMMNENDEKSAFIAALRPLLSEKRQKKADDAVMMLKFMKIINIMQENGK